MLSTQTWNGSAELTEFHHPDRLGTKLVTDNVNSLHYEQSTLPFGTSLDAEFVGTPTTNLKFTSYVRSATTGGLDYAVNRSYSSGQGRFTTVDPIGFGSSEIGNPQSLNLFAYVENNPIDFVDPSGLDLIIICRAIIRQRVIPSLEGGLTISEIVGWDCEILFDGGGGFLPPTSNPGTGGNIGGGGGITPLPGDLRDRVVDIANNCKDFMNKFFDQLSKFGKVHSRDFGTLFDRVGKNNIFLKGKDKGIGATADSGFALNMASRQIPINPLMDNGSNPNQEQANSNNYAETTMQELLHHSKDGKRSTFSDKELDMAAVNMLPEKDRPAALQEVERLRKMHPKPGTYGSYGHNAVSKNCNPTNPYGPPPKQN